MSEVNHKVAPLKEPDENLSGFTYAVPVGPVCLIHYDGLETQVIGETAAQISTPRHKIWADMLVRAALNGPSSAMRLDEARAEFAANGVVIQTVVTRTGITPLWAIPAQRWNKGVDKEDLGLRLAQMRFIVQGAGLDDPTRYNPPNIHLPMLLPVNPYCAGAGLADGCRDLPAVVLQCRFVVQEMRDRWAMVVPHDQPWRRKADNHYLVDTTDQPKLYSLLSDDGEI